MRRKFLLVIILLLILNDVLGKNGNRTKQAKPHKNHNNSKHKIIYTRVKRFIDDDDKILDKINTADDPKQLQNYLDGTGKKLKLKSDIEKEFPFWGTRGRRESFSEETVPDVQLPNSNQNKHSYKLIWHFKGKPLDDQDILPFWSSRGRRESDESEGGDLNPSHGFNWKSRVRRQDDEPFWGTRGRRHEDSPFWGNIERRENILSNDIGLSLWNNRKNYDDDEPFWGNRGRRQEPEPFWGNRGRRDLNKSFSGSREKKKTDTLYWNKGLTTQKNELKDFILETINGANNKINNMARNRRNDGFSPFWINRGRDSQIKSLFNGIARNRMQYNPNNSNKFTNELRSKTFQQNTVQDDRIYAEEPHYILVDRSSRSSGEDDPFFISRGKKYSDFDLAKAVRGRRGAIEEIVKSVRNDPYYIARGKKDSIETGNTTTTQGEYLKTRDLVCSTVDLLMNKYEGKTKRQANDNERDRRTTLKKLALQLQMDPYYVSRGKKDLAAKIAFDDLQNFINKIIALCN